MFLVFPSSGDIGKKTDLRRLTADLTKILIPWENTFFGYSEVFFFSKTLFYKPLDFALTILMQKSALQYSSNVIFLLRDFSWYNRSRIISPRYCDDADHYWVTPVFFDRSTVRTDQCRQDYRSHRSTMNNHVLTIVGGAYRPWSPCTDPSASTGSIGQSMGIRISHDTHVLLVSLLPSASDKRVPTIGAGTDQPAIINIMSGSYRSYRFASDSGKK